MRVIGIYLHVFDLGRKGRVAAVVRPISVYHLDFRFRRVPALFFEIIAHERQIFHAHGEPVLFVVSRDLLVGHGDEPRHLFHVLRLHLRAGERLGLGKGNFRTFHGVDKVLFDAGKLFVGNAFHRDDARAFDERARLSR